MYSISAWSDQCGVVAPHVLCTSVLHIQIEESFVLFLHQSGIKAPFDRFIWKLKHDSYAIAIQGMIQPQIPTDEGKLQQLEHSDEGSAWLSRHVGDS